LKAGNLQAMPLDVFCFSNKKLTYLPIFQNRAFKSQNAEALKYTPYIPQGNY
jgi:hypothetical protein